MHIESPASFPSITHLLLKTTLIILGNYTIITTIQLLLLQFPRSPGWCGRPSLGSNHPAAACWCHNLRQASFVSARLHSQVGERAALTSMSIHLTRAGKRNCSWWMWFYILSLSLNSRPLWWPGNLSSHLLLN